jgi:2-polyprenyl-3-methyl-5-hydroxy-6-metoxy-1,4-benzoquinol methylase/tetratricopeptide (TPR) repeat protein
MRVLLLTGSAARYMAPPRLADDQVNAGPDWTDERDASGRWRSLQTPAGEYSLSTVFAKLPMDQWPDVLVCLVDSSRRNLPRNLATFRGPKVLLLADTHHLQAPLMTMIRYAAAEPFDRIVFLYDRHHAPLFGAAGFKNLFWFPGLTLPHDDAAVAASWNAPRASRIAFVGQAGKHHPRRARLLSALLSARLPLEQRQLPQAEALPFYGASLLGFNSSLNGDLNLRVFELLASGTLLLTDELAPGSGLALLGAQGCGFATYRDEQELLDKARHYLAHPDEARVVSEAGREWFVRTCNAQARQAMFAALALEGRAPEPFPLPETDTRAIPFSGTRDVLANTMVYEGVQELHRVQERVRVAVTAGAPENFAALCRTLPRVELVAHEAGGQADLLVASAVDSVVASNSAADRVWCWDAVEAQLPELAQIFARNGYASASNELAVFCRDAQAMPVPTATEQANEARMLYQRGDYNRALELGRAALQRDPRNVAALTLLADLALLKQGGPLAEKLLRQARAVAPQDSTIAAALAEALILQRKDAEAEKLLRVALRDAPSDWRALRAQARLHELRGDFAGAVQVLEQAAAIHPGSVDVATRLAHALRRTGRVIEGIAWQRRAFGATGEIAAVDLTRRPLRVALLVQHAQGWSSLESVWAALCDDADCVVEVIAAPYLHEYPPEGGPEAIYDFLTRAGIPFRRWDASPLPAGFADVVFVQNPYDVTRPEALRTPRLLQLVPRLAYVPYGLEIGGGETNARYQHNLPLQQVAWALFARSARHRAMFERHCETGAAHIAVTGHPKLDQLRQLDRMQDPEFAALGQGRKIVLWNPQFDVRADGTGYSTFLLWQEVLLGEFARRPDLALVIRPHPLFFGALESRKVWSKEQVADFLARCAALPNVAIDRRTSYLPIFAASAAMISDASSFLLEYAATEKPLLYLPNERGPQLNSDGEFVERHCAVARTADQIRAFLDEVAAGRDAGRDQRLSALAEFLHRPEEGAGRAIVRELKDRMRRDAELIDSLRRQEGQKFWASCSNTHLAPRDYYVKAARALARRLPTLLAGCEHVVDVGCGNGEMTLLAAPFATRVTGYDVSPSLIEQARAAARRAGVSHARFEVLDLEQGLQEVRADAVFCLGVFACIHDDSVWAATLRQFAGMLPQGGVMVLRETVSPDVRRTKRHPQGYYACYRPVSEYLAAVQGCGFDLEEDEVLFADAEGLENHLWTFRLQRVATPVGRLETASV